MPTLDLTCAQAHSHICGRFFYRTPRSASWHTHTSSCVLEICLMVTHTYTHPHLCPRLIACTNPYFSFTFIGAFPLHACCVTRNWRTYFISVRHVFLVETVVLQTVLWDIRAWSARFLVSTLLLTIERQLTYQVKRLIFSTCSGDDIWRNVLESLGLLVALLICLFLFFN